MPTHMIDDPDGPFLRITDSMGDTLDVVPNDGGDTSPFFIGKEGDGVYLDDADRAVVAEYIRTNGGHS